jgi:hypothetical protein
MFRFFLRLSQIFSKFPSSLLALLYFLAIPSFAGIYTLLPNAFFHATSKYESKLNVEEQKKLVGLHTSIVSSFTAKYQNSMATIDGFLVNIEKIRLSSFRYPDTESTRVQFTARFEFRGTDELEGVIITEPYYMSFDAQIAYMAGLPDDPDRVIYSLTQALHADHLSVPIKKLFCGQPKFSQRIPNVPRLTIPGDLHDQITAYINAKRGFPSAISGSFARMFYFSAVTITTLGYGDIVPITHMTRWLVALESIVGIFLVGLFLNSLSHEYNELKSKYT